MAALFAVQVLAAGLCLFTPAVHAGVVSGMDTEVMDHKMVSHCDDGSDAKNDGAGHAGHDAPCAHCDLPDEMVGKVSPLDFSAKLPMVALVAEISPALFHAPVDLAVRTPTGPPDSSFLLYSTTQRIRI